MRWLYPTLARIFIIKMTCTLSPILLAEIARVESGTRGRAAEHFLGTILQSHPSVCGHGSLHEAALLQKCRG